VLLELEARLLPDDPAEPLAPRGMLKASPLADEVSWLALCPGEWPVQLQLELDVPMLLAAVVPAAVALAMAPRPSKHPSSSGVARMAISP
jgi:hypothetical protein